MLCAAFGIYKFLAFSQGIILPKTLTPALRRVLAFCMISKIIQFAATLNYKPIFTQLCASFLAEMTSLVALLKSKISFIQRWYHVAAYPTPCLLSLGCRGGRFTCTLYYINDTHLICS
jgi:hypothetical protein